MDSQYLLNLLKKYRQGRCSTKELEQLDGWYDAFDVQADQIPSVPEEKLEMLLKNIEHQIDSGEKKKRRRLLFEYSVAGIAASILLILGGIRYVVFPISDSADKVQIIRPGQRYAQLQLSDGSVVRLDSGSLVREVDGTLLKNDSSYVLDYSAMRVRNSQNIYNTIRVPVGGEYNLRLADGTQVWMNSGSSLTFPVTFQGDSREVVLGGEAYFNVTKSLVPFIVKTSEMDIKVLGTSFNVSVYEDDGTATATLISGSVEVYEHHSQQKYKIVPGNTLAYRKSTKEVTIENSDTDIYTSWIKGEFKFRDMRLEEIMVKLNRWYNCTIDYEDPTLKDLHFSGAAEKDRPIGYLLEMIEAITDVRFKIEGNKIIVMNK